MSYLAAHATRRPGSDGRGVDERLTLNLPQFDGGAHIRVFVEDTTFRTWRGRPPEPRIRFRVTDCSNEIALWFELSTPDARENALFKIDTLLGAVQRFRHALHAEAELYAQREQHAAPRTGRG